MLHFQVDPLNREGRLQLLVGTAQTHAHKTRQLKRARGLFTNKTNRIMKCLQRTIFTRLIVARKLNKLVKNRSLSRPPKNHTWQFTMENAHTNVQVVENLLFIHLTLKGTWFTMEIAHTNVEILMVGATCVKKKTFSSLSVCLSISPPPLPHFIDP